MQLGTTTTSCSPASCRNIVLSDLPLCRSVLHRQRVRIRFSSPGVRRALLAWQHRKPRSRRATWDHRLRHRSMPVNWPIQTGRPERKREKERERGDLTVNLTLFARQLVAVVVVVVVVDDDTRVNCITRIA